MTRKGGLRLLFRYSLDTDLPYRLRQGWRHVQYSEACDAVIKVFICIEITWNWGACLGRCLRSSHLYGGQVKMNGDETFENFDLR